MQRYQIVVNGNTYTVRVKNLIGNTAVVDVDGWEFQVAIADGEGPADFTPVIAAAATGQAIAAEILPDRAAPNDGPSPPPAPVVPKGKRRSSALEDLSPKKTSVPKVEGKGVVAARLPGLVTSILVKVGQQVKAGDIVCKMEAMKMENDIRAEIDGVVKEILVELQQNVLENQPLMIID